MSCLSLSRLLLFRQVTRLVTYPVVNRNVPVRWTGTMDTRKHRLMYHRSKDIDAVQFKPPKRSEWIEWNQRSELFAFSQRLHEGISERNLRIAFTDPTYIELEKKRREELGVEDVPLVIEDNKDLASKGSELMSPFIKKYLRYFLPKLPEEGIRSLHDYLLDQSNLAVMSKHMGTYDIIMCREDPPTESNLAQVLLAVIGALFEEKGADHTHKFIIDYIMTYLHDKHILEIWDFEPLSALQTILKNDGRGEPEARLLRDTGRNTIEPCFQVGIFSDKTLIGSASAENIQMAQEMACFDALKILFEMRPGDFFFKYGPESYQLDYNSCTAENQYLQNWTTINTKSVKAKRLDG